MLLTRTICEVCNAPIDVDKHRTSENTVTCYHCEAKYVVPKDRGSEIRLEIALENMRQRRFDEAAETFREVARQDKTEPMAYFGMALAEFGVQYIPDKEESADKEIIDVLRPICHKLPDKSILKDANYLKALEFGGKEQREIFQKEAGDIDYIHKQFRRFQDENLIFDCFICVKVTEPDNPKKKTQDSICAGELYELLKNEDLNPFYSEKVRMKEGTDYEAMILYALYSARCMLIVCFDSYYLKTPWVKNEYVRYVSMLKAGQKDGESLAFVYDTAHGSPIDRLPGLTGSRQSFDYSGKLHLKDNLISFVREHAAKREGKAKAVTPEERQALIENARAREYEGKTGVKIQADTTTSIEAARKVLKRGQFEAALDLFEEALSKNKKYYLPLWGKLLCLNCAKDDDELVGILSRAGAEPHRETFSLFSQVVSDALAEEKATYLKLAEKIFFNVLRADGPVKAHRYFMLLAEHKKNIPDFAALCDKYLAAVCGTDKKDFLLDALKEEPEKIAKKHCGYFVRFGEYNRSQARFDLASFAAERALEAVKNEPDALWLKICCLLKAKDSAAFDKNAHLLGKNISIWEKIIERSDETEINLNVKRLIEALLKNLENGDSAKEAFDVFKEAITYIPKSAAWDAYYCECCYRAVNLLLGHRLFESAGELCNNLIKKNGEDWRGYWGLLRAKAECRTEDDLVFHKKPITGYGEYTYAVQYEDTAQQKIIDDIVKRQKHEFKTGQEARDREAAEAVERKRAKAAAKAAKKRKKQERLKTKAGKFFRKLPYILLIIAVAAGFVVADIWGFKRHPALFFGLAGVQVCILSALIFCGGKLKNLKIIIISSIAVVFSAVYFPSVFAGDGNTPFFNGKYRPDISKEYYFRNGADGVALTRYIGKDAELSIPSELDGKPVAVLDKGMLTGKNITSLDVPFLGEKPDGNGAAHLGWLFGMKTPLAGNTVPAGLKKVTVRDGRIYERAFYNCASVSEISTGGKLNYVGADAFTGTAWLKNHEDGAVYFETCLYSFKGEMESGYTLNVREGTVNIMDFVFGGQSNLIAAVMPDSVVSIGAGVFERTALASVVLSKNLKAIPANTFAFCTNLADIDIPDSVTEIGMGAFFNCVKLEIASLTNVREIGANAFSNCVKLKTAEMSLIESIGNKAFNECVLLPSIDIPATIRYIGDSAFSDCYELLNIVIHTGAPGAEWHQNWDRRCYAAVSFTEVL